MDTVFQTFHQASSRFAGPLLATTLSPIPPDDDPTLLHRFHRDSNVFSIQSDIQKYIKARPLYLPIAEANAWIDIYVAYWKALGEILRAETGHHRDDWAIKVYEAWKEILTLLIRGYSPTSGFEAWTMPCLYTVGKYLRVFAIKADEEQSKTSEQNGGPVKMELDGLGDDVMESVEKNKWLEDAARVINEVFRLCISDRAPLEDSRKWGIYNTTNLLFKTYFKLNSIGLSKNILRALQATKADLPAIENFPKSHIVTFKYYVGVIHFLDEEYVRAEESLTEAFHMCHKKAHRNKELLLTYLIPTHLHTSHTLPPPSLLTTHPYLQTLFSHLLHAIRSGHLASFSTLMLTHESQYVRRRIYLSLERARDLCVRNLLRKVWLMEGGKENTRVKVGVFAAAMRFSMMPLPGRDEMMGAGLEKEEGMEDDEVECLIAGLIYKGLIKGYIAHDHGIVVLNRKGEAFPGTGV
ncbi:MAG: hypothetical protein LQ350_006567 [Teloschistes chrysophthalmus]|nr:MAG: hypothetical protein LQ350_006567 [Niorma chrysophthalma]